MESFIVSGNNVFDLQRIQDRLLNVNDTPKIKMPVKIPAIMKKWKKSAGERGKIGCKHLKCKNFKRSRGRIIPVREIFYRSSS